MGKRVNKRMDYSVGEPLGEHSAWSEERIRRFLF
jgi:hypothetical protein